VDVKLPSLAWSGPTVSGEVLARMGRPVVRLSVVMTTFGPISGAEPGCSQASPISRRRSTMLGASFPSRLGAAFSSRLQ